MSALTEEEGEQFKNMLSRIHTVFQAAKDMDVRVMVDAEQTYFQPAISRITMEMMTKYNKEKAVVFNTYQCYLKEAYNNLILDLEQSDRFGNIFYSFDIDPFCRQDFFFGAKLVRGAYMNQVSFNTKKQKPPRKQKYEHLPNTRSVPELRPSTTRTRSIQILRRPAGCTTSEKEKLRNPLLSH